MINTSNPELRKEETKEEGREEGEEDLPLLWPNQKLLTQAPQLASKPSHAHSSSTTTKPHNTLPTQGKTKNKLKKDEGEARRT